MTGRCWTCLRKYMVRDYGHIWIWCNLSPPADAPIKDIHTFIGTFTLHSTSSESDPEQQIPQVTPLTAENMLWSNTVLAAGSAIGMVVYTGKETRAVMNTSHPETKVGLLDLEINRVAKASQSHRRISPADHAIDSLCCNLCSFRPFSRSQRLPRTMVYLCIPILNSFF
jgi:hypothetical protein